MDTPFDKSWQIQPIESDSGLTYQGETEKGKVFIKRNSSPFLAVLAQEGIAPRLLWTKRIGNGDVVTAQEWLDGRSLTSDEMKQNYDVIEILHRVHVSPLLKKMLLRIKHSIITPESLLESISVENIPEKFCCPITSDDMMAYLRKNVPELDKKEFVVCHGEPLKNNWLLTDSGRLYLVDWDTVVLADPAYDIAQFLVHYLSYDEWDYWLETYDILSGRDLFDRITWYAIYYLVTERHYLTLDQKAIITKILNR